MKWLLVILLSLFAGACKKKPVVKKSNSYIFSISNFLDGKNKLHHDSLSVLYYDKTVSIGNTTETKRYKTLQWDVEYKPFVVSELQKSSWYDYIAKDSTGNTVIYTTHNTSIPVKKMILDYENGVLQDVKIWKGTKSIFLENNTELYLDKEGNSRITQKQKLLFFAPKIMSITIHPVRK